MNSIVIVPNVQHLGSNNKLEKAQENSKIVFANFERWRF